MPDLRDSETAKNLMRAFAGESQARNRYTFAAALARFQKMPVVEQIFTYTANQEKEHAEIFYKFLEPLDKETIFIDGGYPVDMEQNTLAQLNAAAHNEFEEHDVVYKSFGDIAQGGGLHQDRNCVPHDRGDREDPRGAVSVPGGPLGKRQAAYFRCKDRLGVFKLRSYPFRHGSAPDVSGLPA